MGKRFLCGVLIVFLWIGPVFAAQYLGVPLDDRAYQVLDNAVAEGAISTLPNIRPYTAEDMTGYLSLIENSDLLTEKERSEVRFLIAELKRRYGTEIPEKQNVWKRGAVIVGDEKRQTNAKIGARFTFQETGGTRIENLSFAYDSRNAVTAYFMGDLGTHLSYSMDFTFRVDRLDDSVFLLKDFTIPAEGFYQYLDLFGTGIEGWATTLPMEGFANSSSSYPEVVASFMDSRLNVRFGSVRRDWGPGLNNLLLSGSARPFDAVDATFSFTPHLRMGFVTGSLGVFSMTDEDEENFVSYTKSELQKYKNNYSAHRVEWDVTPHLTLALSEGVVYRRRFVFGYLNPFSVYYVVQGAEGDMDNCIASFDFQYTLPGVARMYGSFVATEISAYGGFGKILVNPRNAIGLQGGADIPLHFGSFATLTAQITYLSPFVYTHYLDDEDEEGVSYSTTYINKGQNLGYSLSQNTIEYLLSLRNGLSDGLTGWTTVKLRQRSYQYGKSNIATNFDYDYDGSYAFEDFFHFIGNYTLSIEMGLEKQFVDFPLTLSGSLQFQTEWGREITNSSNSDNKYGYTTLLGDWESPVFGLYGTIGVKLYY